METSKVIKQTLNVIVVACTKDGVIGKGNTLPWNYPEDLKFFKKLTTGNVVIMGRKTFSSIKMSSGLPNRLNRVITSNPQHNKDSLEYYTKLEDALTPVEGKINFIIGGSSIYQYALENNLVDIIVMTRIVEKHDGDKYFPISSLKDLGFTYERKIAATMPFDIIQLSKDKYANSQSVTKLVYPVRQQD